MDSVFKALNRGPIFRLTHALGEWRKRRRYEQWRRSRDRQAQIDPEVLITGNDDALAWIEIGRGTEIQRHCRIHIAEDESLVPRLKIGARVFIGQGTHMSVMRPMNIGDNTIIGAHSYLLTNNHRFESRTIPIRDQGYDCAPLTVGEDVWLGASCVILPGIVIGRGAIIGAGAVVTKAVGDYEIWGGIPARKLGERPG